MKVIKNFNLVNELTLPEQVKSALHSELTIPFDGDVNSTTDFWHEYDTFLILLEEGDVDSSLVDADEDIQYFIQYVTDNPEFVILLNDDTCPYLLALSVTTTAGGGCYLLAPLTSKTSAITILSKLI
ncbi:hypothetical protein [Moritella viscosa]|uniref:Uncharacterized protein n=1 Tax=Moritella viscosa TaxID=80854 RepID=A0A1L0BC51_9GAMM|nr:hypothetical protein [Moritella viscosa]SGZ00821.1 Putative uncharacterized protein [Moritella viscosa]SHO14320.1 Putative uncharacterized protein [Moritella viscosa]SHO14369.1 Putative uncharacterized protein [Moritella viscosa]SHO18287.1 Putative uncharacterized protein [Moritella viscosa]SHO18889.1 Putative uncharacterized protein [Moritella viscosa]